MIVRSPAGPSGTVLPLDPNPDDAVRVVIILNLAVLSRNVVAVSPTCAIAVGTLR